jgi:glucokinase
MSTLSLGIDLSAATPRIVVADRDGAVVARDEAATAKAVRDAVKRVLAESGPVSAAAVAVASPGDAVPDGIVSALGAKSKKLRVIPVAAGTAAALAEHWCGAARGVRHVATVSVASHVTAGVVIDGEAFLGAHGLASSAGWFALNPVEREDYRRLGGLEAEVAAAGIVRRLVWRIKSGDHSSVTQKAGGDYSKIQAGDIFEAARAGDGVSISIVRDTAKYIGMAVANIAAIVDPEIIVLGGLVAEFDELLLEPIRFECSRRLRPPHFKQLRIVASELGADAVALGAARAAARSGA